MANGRGLPGGLTDSVEFAARDPFASVLSERSLADETTNGLRRTANVLDVATVHLLEITPPEIARLEITLAIERKGRPAGLHHAPLRVPDGTTDGQFVPSVAREAVLQAVFLASLAGLTNPVLASAVEAPALVVGTNVETLFTQYAILQVIGVTIRCGVAARRRAMGARARVRRTLDSDVPVRLMHIDQWMKTWIALGADVTSVHQAGLALGRNAVVALADIRQALIANLVEARLAARAVLASIAGGCAITDGQATRAMAVVLDALLSVRPKFVARIARLAHVPSVRRAKIVVHWETTVALALLCAALVVRGEVRGVAVAIDADLGKVLEATRRTRASRRRAARARADVRLASVAFEVKGRVARHTDVRLIRGAFGSAKPWSSAVLAAADVGLALVALGVQVEALVASLAHVGLIHGAFRPLCCKPIGARAFIPYALQLLLTDFPEMVARTAEAADEGFVGVTGWPLSSDAITTIALVDAALSLVSLRVASVAGSAKVATLAWAVTARHRLAVLAGALELGNVEVDDTTVHH